MYPEVWCKGNPHLLEDGDGGYNIQKTNISRSNSAIIKHDPPRWMSGWRTGRRWYWWSDHLVNPSLCYNHLPALFYHWPSPPFYAWDNIDWPAPWISHPSKLPSPTLTQTSLPSITLLHHAAFSCPQFRHVYQWQTPNSPYYSQGRLYQGMPTVTWLCRGYVLHHSSLIFTEYHLWPAFYNNYLRYSIRIPLTKFKSIIIKAKYWEIPPEDWDLLLVFNKIIRC